MKKAFMRGVCALNMEAMSMFKEGQPPEEDVESHAFEPPVNNNYYPCTVGASSADNNEPRTTMNSLETMQTRHSMYNIIYISLFLSLEKLYFSLNKHLNDLLNFENLSN